VLTALVLVAVGYALWLGFCVRNAGQAPDAVNEPMREAERC
jgi:hypothetical protein